MKNNRFDDPSRKDIVLTSTVWFVGNLLLILSMTDLFSESFFQSKYMMMYFLIITSTVAVMRFIYNYFHK